MTILHAYVYSRERAIGKLLKGNIIVGYIVGIQNSSIMKALKKGNGSCLYALPFWGGGGVILV